MSEQGELFDPLAPPSAAAPGDALLALVGEALPPPPDERPSRGERRFWDWYAHRSRGQQSREDARNTESGVSAFVERVSARLASLAAPLRRVETAALRHPAIVGGPVSSTLALARAAGAAPLVEVGVAAGSGREIWDEVTDAWVLVPEDLPSHRYVAMRVTGDSMTPLLHSDDVVLIDLDDGDTSAGAIVVARNADDGYVVKQITANDGFDIELGSLNPDYAPLHISATRNLVLGRVVLRWCEH